MQTNFPFVMRVPVYWLFLTLGKLLDGVKTDKPESESADNSPFPTYSATDTFSTKLVIRLFNLVKYL